MHFLGTSWRERDPSETLSLVEPHLVSLGICKFIEYKSAEEIYIFEAVRNNAYSGYLNLGKGFSSIAAKASATMEAVEMSLVEVPQITGRLLKINYDKVIRFHKPNKISLPKILESEAKILSGINLTSGLTCNVLENDVFFPNAYLSGSPLKGLTNGLASGNTLYEAILHGIYELIERDAIYKAYYKNREPKSFCPLSLNDIDILKIYESLDSQGIRLELKLLESSISSAIVVESSVYIPDSNSNYCQYKGWGCDVDSIIASRRAIAEAIQVRRITEEIKNEFIAGSRRPGGFVISSEYYNEVAKAQLLYQPLEYWTLRGLTLEPCCFPGRLTSSSSEQQIPELLVRRILDELYASIMASVYCVKLSPEIFPVYVVRCFSPHLDRPPFL